MNVQNIPSTKERRMCFIASKGNYLINADYSTQEIRVGAEFHNNKDMIEFYTKPNAWYGDFHSFSATKLYRVMYNNPDYFCPAKEIDGKPNPLFTKDYAKDRGNSKNNTFLQAYG